MRTTTRSATPTATKPHGTFRPVTQGRSPHPPRTLGDVVSQPQARATTVLDDQDAMREQAKTWSEVFGGIGSLEGILLR